MDILVIGTGYVGLVTGSCFAEMGHHVVCLDINKQKIADLNKGIIPIYEPGLEEIVKRNLKAGRLSFITSYSEALDKAAVCFLTVDTPMLPDGSADISNLVDAAKSLAKQMKRYLVIVTKSTVPVGTTEYLGQCIHEVLESRNLSIPYDVVSNPEFLKEGNAVQDFMKPDRVIIGVAREQPVPLMKELYSPFMLNHDRLLIMDIRSAELAKYAANTMLAIRITLMNQLSGLCEILGANIDSIRKAVGSDHRIGHHFLYAGPGYGGSCLPKDVRALYSQGLEHDYEMSLVKAIHNANESQKKVMSKKIETYFLSQETQLRNKVIGILGIAFKPDTDDIRESSALVLIEDLLEKGVILRIYDPAAMEKGKSHFKNNLIIWCQSELEVAKGADAIVLMTEWKQFRFMDFDALLTNMEGNAFFDGRNQYQPDEMAKRGFDYISIGRKWVQLDAVADLEELEIPY